MFKLRVTRDRHPRTKNGQPPQSTTGVAKINSNHCQVLGEANRVNGDTEGAKSDMATSRIGIVSTVQIQSLLVMFTNSGFFSSSAVTVLGSRAMPQIGHEPGLSRTIWGCMGHVYSVLVAGAAATTGSSAIPHFGQSPGPCWRISGSIGQVYSFEACRGDLGGGAGAIDVSCGAAEGVGLPRMLVRRFRTGRVDCHPAYGVFFHRTGLCIHAALGTNSVSFWS